MVQTLAMYVMPTAISQVFLISVIAKHDIAMTCAGSVTPVQMEWTQLYPVV